VTTPTQLSTGTVFAGDFKVVRPLRAGGMGAVYVVEQLSTGKQRALKLMMPELVGNPEVRERFEREAKVAAGIESDHVVETVTAGVDADSGAPYLVMELLRGEELADAAMRMGPLPIADVGDIFDQIGHALEQAHKQGLVHRDLKPENIYLCVSKRRDVAFTAKILDFGIAKLVADGMQKTGTQPLGSPLYMAPEQTDRKGRICPATDVWALGLIAFYLLTGRSFWIEADGGSLPQLLREIVFEPIPPATERATALGVASLLPEGFDAWFARCVDRDVDARFGDAGEATRAFAALVPKGVTARVLAVRTSNVEGAVKALNEDVASLPTQMADVTAVGAGETGAAITRIGEATTGGASAMVQAPEVTTRVAPAPPWYRRPPLLLGTAVAAFAGGIGLYYVQKPTTPTLSATPGLTASASARALSSASGSASAAPSGGASLPPLAADPRCPAGMIFHPGGPTILGAKDLHGANGDARLTHAATLSPYCLDRTEVTVRAYEECVGAGMCERTPNDVSYEGVTDATRKVYTPFCNARKPDRLDHPINCVDWTMASAFCAWKKARLPTEAEWELAARGMQQHDYPWGDEPPDEKHLNAAGAEYSRWAEGAAMKVETMFPGDDGFQGTAPVGSFPSGASQLGVLDLAGNVWEWTADWYGPYTSAAVIDPKGPETGTRRVVRGGAFNGFMFDWAKPAYRWKSLPESYNHGIGFRCAADPKAG
jgi:formylglycine-generating enzyme required for sulfatase activity/tRNA A-37 threonylcarbamoyl transferase component Bud32